MAPITTASNEKNHDALLDKLDIYAIRKPFRNPNWRPPQRRNKNVKQIIADAARKEASASVLATQNNSGTSTPALVATHGDVTDSGLADQNRSNVSQAAQTLSALVTSKASTQSLTKRATAAAAAATSAANLGAPGGQSPAAGPPVPTYTNIESAPSLHPSSQRRYCDITGLPAKYTDPKTRLRYYDKEIFGVVRGLGMGGVDKYLAARGVNTVLK